MLKCDDNAKGVLKRKRLKRRIVRRKSLEKVKMESFREKKELRWGGTSSDSDTSSSGSSTSSSSSSSMEGSSAARNKSSTSYDKIFEDTKDTAAAPPFVYVKGLPHFRSKAIGDLVNAGKPPHVKTRKCRAALARTFTSTGRVRPTAVKGPRCAKNDEPGPPSADRAKSHAGQAGGGNPEEGRVWSVPCRSPSHGRRE